MKVLFIFLISALVHLSCLADQCYSIYKLKEGHGYLELMNSPKLKKWGRQGLRVSFKMDRIPGDKIRIIQESPTRKVIYESLVSKDTNNYIDTDETNEKNHKYSVEYLRKNGTVVNKSPFTDRPGWMHCMREYIGPRKVNKVFFPGTHNSGSYRLPSLLDSFTTFTKYKYNQDETVEDQLNRGARYLDLRIGRYAKWRSVMYDKEIWYINHNTLRIRPLITVINEIKRFLSRWPQEIIIIDLHQFPCGFSGRSTHEEFANYIKREFGSLLHKVDRERGWSITFNELWSTKARILLSHNDEYIAAKYGFYPQVKQLWADTDEYNKLMDYIEKHLPRTCTVNQMTAVMAQKTARWYRTGWYGGTRGLAHVVNADITIKFATGKWGDTAQAVAVDYLSSTGIVAAAIIQNYKRSEPGHICY